MSRWWEATRNCTLLGSLNPSILVPEWLVKQGILPDLRTDSRIQMVPGSETRVVFENSLYSWFVDRKRLVVQGISSDSNPGEFVAAVMNTLVHTPVEAIGNNLVAECSDEAGTEAWAKYSVDLPGEIAGALLGHEMTHRFEYDDAIVTLKLLVEVDTVKAADVNFHRPVSSLAEAVDAANRWPTDRQHAESFLAKIFGEKDAPH